jgi:D-Tyr-tRNAtyr deacylase
MDLNDLKVNRPHWHACSSSALIAPRCVGGEVVARSGRLLVLVGRGCYGPPRGLRGVKVTEARVFPDDGGRMNRSVRDAGGRCSSSRSSRCSAICGKAEGLLSMPPMAPDAARDLRILLTDIKNGIPIEAGVFQPICR